VNSSSNTTTPSTSSESSGSSGLGGGAIAGVVIGAIAGVLIVVGIIAFFLIRRRRQRRAAQHAQDSPPSYSDGVASQRHALEMESGCRETKKAYSDSDGHFCSANTNRHPPKELASGRQSIPIGELDGGWRHAEAGEAMAQRRSTQGRNKVLHAPPP
jgi:hypothetical protein